MKKRYQEKKEARRKDKDTRKNKEENKKPSDKKAKKRVLIVKIKASERKQKKLSFLVNSRID